MLCNVSFPLALIISINLFRNFLQFVILLSTVIQIILEFMEIKNNL